jgi:HEAT repeat protein
MVVRRIARRLVTLTTGTLLLGSSGCAGTNTAQIAMPWSSSTSDTSPGITTPAEHMAELKALAKKASKATPQEQERVSQDLAHRIQSEQDPLIRQQIVKTLSNYPNPMSAAVLQAAVGDDDPDVRIAACRAWGKRKGPEAVQQLARVIASDTNVDVRLAATRALGETGQREAIAPLSEALVDKDPAMQHRAVESLRGISGQDFGNDVNAWREYAQSGRADVAPSGLAQRMRKLF